MHKDPAAIKRREPWLFLICVKWCIPLDKPPTPELLGKAMSLTKLDDGHSWWLQVLQLASLFHIIPRALDNRRLADARLTTLLSPPCVGGSPKTQTAFVLAEVFSSTLKNPVRKDVLCLARGISAVSSWLNLALSCRPTKNHRKAGKIDPSAYASGPTLSISFLPPNIEVVPISAFYPNWKLTSRVCWLATVAKPIENKIFSISRRRTYVKI